MNQINLKSKLDIDFFANFRNILVFFLLIIIIAIFSLTIDGFFAIQNFNNISRQIAVLGIISVGMTLAILSGGIDLSVGSILALSISIGGIGITNGWSISVVYPLIIAVGLLLGAINGALITKLNIPAIIVTLGTMNIFRGAAMVITNGVWVSPIPSEFLIIGKGYIPAAILVIIFIVFIVVNTYTKFGRNLYAIGGNEQAAIFSGVPVIKYKMYIYIISGFLCPIAGILFIGRSGFVQPQVGIGYEMNAIAAVVIGGTSIWGGSGSVLKTLVGAIFMGVIIAGLTMLGVNPYWRGAIIGLLILIAISVDSIRYYRIR